MSSIINQDIISKSWSYNEYIQLLEKLVQQDKTTGNDQSESMVNYTRLNLTRMNRLAKTVEITDSLKNITNDLKKKQLWVVLTEGWCGDAAQNIPAFQKMAETSDQIALFLISRDENPEVMDAYLTNGGKSIPKLICLNENLQELGTWGPRPIHPQKMVQEYKKNTESMTYEELQKDIQLWYLKDKTLSLQKEFEENIKSWNKKALV